MSRRKPFRLYRIPAICARVAIATCVGVTAANAEYSIERISLSSSRDATAAYLLYTPSTAIESQRYPGVIALYGAGGSLQHYNFADPAFEELRNELDRRGYFVIVPELGPSHFMDANAVQRLDAVLQDVLTRRPIDGEEICLIGSSMGGGSAFAYAIQRPGRIRAIVSHMGMTDFAVWWNENPKFRPVLERSFGGSPATNADEYVKRSALTNVAQLRDVPVMCIHGKQDATVRATHSEALSQARKSVVTKTELRLIDGDSHDNSTMRDCGVMVAAFLDQSLNRLQDHKPAEALGVSVQLNE
jgi:dipeptidyl aminopeptidase/acylaminoacyl peptidase